MPVDTDGEVLTLRAALRDLVALSAMSAAWISSEPATVAAGLADALIGLLRLDFVFVRLCVPGVPGVVDVRRGKAGTTLPRWLESHLARSGCLSDKEVIPDAGDGVEPCRGVVIPIGINAEGGVLAATCDRIGFPTEMDQLLLSLAGNQAATAFQIARLKEHQGQMWFLEGMDRIDRAIQGTIDVDQMLGDVLDAVLATFGCDRACLVYPCDPGAASHQVRAARIRSGYIGACPAGVDIPNEPGMAGIFRDVRASTGPVRFDPESGYALPPELAARFGIRSMIAIAVYPKVDKPYMFGLHQCSRPRVWTPREQRLFHEAGRRLADALDTLLMFRNLRESERKLERNRAELAASRARIVAAADDARRQIERDLHDGVQQRLVSLALAQQAAEAMVPPGLAELQAQLSRVGGELTGALEELREISHGIHPAVLTRGGLVPALKALARRSSVPVELEVHAGTRLPQPVGVAAYYAVSEALTNAAKHAKASVVHVAVEAREGALELLIRDDGRGGADPARGSGLIGLTDRVDTLGGTLHVASPAGQGTTLRITLPIDEG